MQNIQHRICLHLSDILRQLYLDSIGDQTHLLTPEVMQVNQEHFGHYQCNNALKIAKFLKVNPRMSQVL
jgi:arginyl-tRNA synthetase